MRDLLGKKDVLRKILERGVPGLFVCGAPQLLGRPFLGLFDMETKYPKNKPRLIGNLIAKICHSGFNPESINVDSSVRWNDTFVGFENHGGRTYLHGIEPFAKVIKGYGNNGEDRTEGAKYKNWIATYSHGPLLP